MGFGRDESSRETGRVSLFFPFLAFSSSISYHRPISPWDGTGALWTGIKQAYRQRPTVLFMGVDKLEIGVELVIETGTDTL